MLLGLQESQIPVEFEPQRKVQSTLTGFAAGLKKGRGLGGFGVCHVIFHMLLKLLHSNQCTIFIQFIANVQVHFMQCKASLQSEVNGMSSHIPLPLPTGGVEQGLAMEPLQDAAETPGQMRQRIEREVKEKKALMDEGDFKKNQELARQKLEEKIRKEIQEKLL